LWICGEQADAASGRLTEATLQRRQADVQERQRRAVARVGTLLVTQRRVGAELGAGLQVLGQHRGALERMERQAGDTSLLTTLVRPFTARRSALARRSIAEGLLRQYERVSVRLREATAFADELSLSALELQDEVDRLHAELADAVQRQRATAAAILDLETQLAALDEPASGGDPDGVARARDQLTFELRRESVTLDLLRAAAQLCRHHLPAARSLRDTVLRLREEMAHYVVSATHTVNAAGRRIQGLGLLADAPIVVAELQEGLHDLDLAMRATVDYVERSQVLLAEVLPSLTARLEADAEAGALVLLDREHDRNRSRLEAERVLREAAEAEIDALLGDADLR
jgi:hypothetical protein